jgi:phage baseplate assembly protein W
MTMELPLEDKAFLGVGWAFPVEPDGNGEAALSAYEQDIREAIRIVLGTDRGERVMRPDFGAGLQALAFEPMGAATAGLVKHRVEEALVRWEPRIDVVDVRVREEGELRNRLHVEIDYRVRTTNTFYNLVYPFYVLEGEPT